MSTCLIKFDPRAIFNEMLALEPDERSVTFSLLLRMWSKEGHIEDDAPHNAKVCGMRPTSYRKVFARLVSSGVFNIEDGRIYPGSRIQRAMYRVGISPDQRQRVMREETACAYCGAIDNLQVEHIFPASRGGTNHRDNLALACWPCNIKKRDSTLAELAGSDE